LMEQFAQNSVFPQWDAKTWKQIAMHAAMVAAQLDKLESSGACPSEQTAPVANSSSAAPQPQVGGLVDPPAPSKANAKRKSSSQKAASFAQAAALPRAPRHDQFASTGPSCSEERVERIRRQDREKKRRTRNVGVNLVQQLEDILLKMGHGGTNRTLHETLAGACTAVQSLTSDVMLRRGLLSQRGCGLAILDAGSSTVVDANEFIWSRVGKKPEATAGAPLSSIFMSEFADVISTVIGQLSVVEDSPRQFVIAVRLASRDVTDSTESGECLSAEFLRCFTPGAGRRPLFMVNLLPIRPLKDAATSFVRAFRNIAGFRPEERSVSLIQSAPPFAWKCPSRSRTKPRDRALHGFDLAFRHSVRNGDLGNDFAPVVAPWAVDFFLRGLVSGDWSGLREWVLSPESQPAGPNGERQRAAALRAMDILSGSVPDASDWKAWEQRVLKAGTELDGHAKQQMLPGLQMDMTTEEGTVLIRIRVRGLCLFEYRLECDSLLPVTAFPAHAQNRTVEGNMPMEDMIIKHFSSTKHPSIEVRDDGAIIGHMRPDNDRALRLFGNLGTIHKCIMFERDCVDLDSKAEFSAAQGGTTRQQDRVGANPDTDRQSVDYRGKFKSNKFFVQGDVFFTLSRRWARAGASARQYPDAGGVDVRNALLEMYHAMRVSQGLPVSDVGKPSSHSTGAPSLSRLSADDPRKVSYGISGATVHSGGVHFSSEANSSPTLSAAAHSTQNPLGSSVVRQDCAMVRADTQFATSSNVSEVDSFGIDRRNVGQISVQLPSLSSIQRDAQRRTNDGDSSASCLASFAGAYDSTLVVEGLRKSTQIEGNALNGSDLLSVGGEGSCSNSGGPEPPGIGIGGGGVSLAALLEDPGNGLLPGGTVSNPLDNDLDWMSPSPWNDYYSSIYF